MYLIKFFLALNELARGTAKKPRISFSGTKMVLFLLFQVPAIEPAFEFFRRDEMGQVWAVRTLSPPRLTLLKC